MCQLPIHTLFTQLTSLTSTTNYVHIPIIIIKSNTTADTYMCTLYISLNFSEINSHTSSQIDTQVHSPTRYNWQKQQMFIPLETNLPFVCVTKCWWCLHNVFQKQLCCVRLIVETVQTIYSVHFQPQKSLVVLSWVLCVERIKSVW